MTGEHDSAARHVRLTGLFNAASSLAPERRAAFFDEQCADDAVLRAEVEELLRGVDEPLPLLDDHVGQQPAGGLLGVLANADAHWVGRELGGCKLVALIGAGGMGAVFRAEQQSPRREVALKLVRGGVVDDVALQRFGMESQLLARLRHPGIAQVYAAGVHVEGPLRVPYYVLEFIEGGRAITQYATDEQLDVQARLRLFLKACDALQHAHENRVIHRDVKPDNLLVDQSGHVRVIDFGIARATNEAVFADQRTRTGHLLGTPAYMSPEQIGASSEFLDTRADVYSLGVVLYELLVGRLPIEVEGVSLVEISRRVLEDEPVRLSKLKASLRGDLDTIVATALFKDPRRRYSSAGALAADLRRYLNDEPIAARPATALYQLQKLARRHRGLFGGVTIALIALVAGAGAALWNAARAVDARDEAREIAYDAILSAAAGAIRAFEFDSASRHLAAAPAELRGWEWHYFRARLDDASLVIPHVVEQRAPFGMRDFAFVAGLGEREQLVVSSCTVRDGVECGVLTRYSPTDGAMLAEFQHSPLLNPWSALSAGEVWYTSAGGVLSQYSLRDGALLRSSPLFPVARALDRFQLFRIDDSHCLVSGRLGGESYVLDLDAGTSSPPPQPFKESGVLVRSATSDGTGLISFGRRVWIAPFDPRRPVASCEHSGEPVIACAAHPDGVQYYAACQDGGLLVYRHERDTLQLARRIDAHADAVMCVCVSRDGRFVATGGKDRAVRVWSTDSLALVHTLSGADAAVAALCFSADASQLAASTGARGVLIFDEPTRPDLRVLRGSESYVYQLALAPNGRSMASGDWDGRLRLWDRDSGTQIAHLAVGPSGNSFDALAWSPDGRRLVTCITRSDTESELCVVDVELGVVTARTRTTDLVRTAVWLGPETFVLAGARGVALHRARDCARVQQLTNVVRRAEVTPWSLRWGAARSPSGQQFALALPDGCIDLWSAADVTCSRSIPVHSGAAHCVAWSPDGRFMASGGADRLVRVFDARSGAGVAVLEGHAGAVFDVCFASDGSRVFSGSDDDTIRVWDTRTWRELAQIVGHEDYVFSLACAPDGQLISASGDQTLRLWDDRPRGELLRASRERERLASELAPRVGAWLANDDATAVRELIRDAPGLSARQREVALQLLLARAWH